MNGVLSKCFLKNGDIGLSRKALPLLMDLIHHFFLSYLT